MDKNPNRARAMRRDRQQLGIQDNCIEYFFRPLHYTHRSPQTQLDQPVLPPFAPFAAEQCLILEKGKRNRGKRRKEGYKIRTNESRLALFLFLFCTRVHRRANQTLVVAPSPHRKTHLVLLILLPLSLRSRCRCAVRRSRLGLRLGSRLRVPIGSLVSLLLLLGRLCLSGARCFSGGTLSTGSSGFWLLVLDDDFFDYFFEPAAAQKFRQKPDLRKGIESGQRKKR